MSWFSNRIKKRKEKNQAAFEKSFKTLSGIKSSKDEISDEKLRDDFIIKQFNSYFNIAKVRVPHKINGTYNKLEYVASNSNILSKKIILKNGWYLENRSPILAFTKDEKTPVLLIPKGARDYYYISYQTGKKVRTTAFLANKLLPEAYAFYQSLPSNQLTIKEYLKYFFKSIRKFDILNVILFSISSTAIGMLLPYILKRLTGEVIDNGDLKLYMSVAIYLVSAGIGYILIKATQSFMNARVAIKVEKMMQQMTMKRLLSLPSSFYEKYSTGELSARFSNVSLLSTLMFNGIFLTALSSLLSLVFITQIVQFTPVLILPVIVVILLSSALSIFVAFKEAKVSRRQLLLSSKESGMTYSIINGIQKIRLAGAEKRVFAEWAHSYARSSRLLYRPPVIIRIATSLSLTISLIGNIVIYYIASKANIDVSSYAAFTSSFGILSAASLSLSTITSMLSRVRPTLNMVRPILEEKPEDNLDKEIVESLNGDIKIENVSFKYDVNEPYILKNISLDIKAGECVGIVGQTGCGKSTLIKLLLGFNKTTSGHIYYDGKDIDLLNHQSLRSKIGSVLQNGGIFHASILNNILITAPEKTEQDAWIAATIAGLSEDIKNMPMGMRTIISEGQGSISGGQRQRIMIARAIVNKPKVLLFDEATSALDNETQKKIADAIGDFNCTRIVIAHRLSTIKNCDHIYYLEKGEIVEQGTYTELIQRKGRFFELIERQRIEE